MSESSNPPRGVERKPVFLPILANAFVESGFKGMTTAELARRCEVRENELYRIWPSKKQMFLEAIDYVYRVTTEAWKEVLESPGGDNRTKAERILEFQSQDHGKMRLYRIVFAGLMEADDKEIRLALRSLYKRFATFLSEMVQEHREFRGHSSSELDVEFSTWAIIGIGTIVDIQRELGLLNKSGREVFMRRAAGMILGKDSED